VTTLATTAKHLMNWVMRPLGSVLTTLPVGPDRPGFEIVQPSFYVLPHRDAAWRILAERLDELAGRAERLSQGAGLGQLAELATDLHGMARDIQSAQPAAGRSHSTRRRPPGTAGRYPRMAARREGRRVLAVETSGRFGAILDSEDRHIPKSSDGTGCGRFGSPSSAAWRRLAGAGGGSPCF
jgi:hypothetical protein